MVVEVRLVGIVFVLEKGIMESIINLAGANVDVDVGVVIKIISADVAAFVYAVGFVVASAAAATATVFAVAAMDAFVFDAFIGGETLNHVLSHVELQVQIVVGITGA